MYYSSLDIAKYVIYYSHNNKYSISNLKLQKLLYFIQAYFLISSKQIQCFDEIIEAWDFGVVVPSIYHTFKQYGSGDILEYKDYNIQCINKSDRKMINNVIDELSLYTSTDLVDITQNQYPYKLARTTTSKEVTITSIKEYFN